MSTDALAGWDCHAHLFGPYEQYPLASDRSYTPPPATEDAYRRHLHRLGLDRGVLVHPSAYGDDHSLLLAALREHPEWRGVAVKREAAAPELAELRRQGVRGLRFSQRSGAGTNFAGSASFAELEGLAATMADTGLHAELWTDCATLPGLRDAILALPVPVVLDHMGGFDHAAGLDEAGFQTMVALLDTGRVWVKLCAYRNVLNAPSFEAARPFHQRLLQANPDRLVWGSDWPHLRVAPEPDALDLLQLFRQWTNSDELARRVLVDNPGALYS